MYGGAPVSPTDYLSVERSLQDSRLPPLQNQEALRAAADNARAAKPVNALTAEALTKGLFEFVLERAQQEVAVHFIENLLDKKKAPQIDALFPNVAERYFNLKIDSSQVVDEDAAHNDRPERYFNPQISYSQSFLEGLREAFFIDLKNLGRTMPALLFRDEYFAPLRNDPVFYSVLATYSLFGQSSQGRPLWESAPLVHRELFDRRQAADKKLNGLLAGLNADAVGYKEVRNAARDYVKQLQYVSDKILDVQKSCRERSDTLLNRDTTGQLFYQLALPDNPLYDYRVLIGNVDSSSVFTLDLLPELLHGNLDTNTLREHNTLKDYDLFSRTSSREMRIAGLELARRAVNGSWYNNLSQAGILRRWLADLAAFDRKAYRLETSGEANLVKRLEDIENQRDSLKKVIAETSAYWAEKNDTVDLRPFIQLDAIAGREVGGILDTLDKVQERQQELQGLEKRLALFEQRLAGGKKGVLADSPFQKYLQNKVPTGPFEKLTAEIDILEARSNTLRLELHRLDSLYAPREQKALNSTAPMLQATELLSNLFYVLQDSDGRGLIRPDTFETMLYDPRLRTACLGLMQQRLGR
ncbi:MAG: hypothetical protein J5I98_23560, partial [Phaeodactylibacter sp.]|nr:hypothetical protein [Phaeodactylibacter sp.]